MKVIEQYYGPIRRQDSFRHMDGGTEAFLKVEVDGETLCAHQTMPRVYGPPYQYVMRELQRMISVEIEKKLFGCFR